jgi:hypothetical protein
MTLRAAATGKVVKVIARLEAKSPQQLSTQFGFALSPDARYVYCTSTAKRGRSYTLDVVQIDVATGRRTFIAFGAQPAVSPDGRLLAYVANTYGYLNAIAVRDVLTGRTQLVNLAGSIGRGKNLLNAVVAWFANGSDVAVVPADSRPPVIGGAPLPSGQRMRSCPAGSATTCLIVVHRLHAGGALTARYFAVAVPDDSFAAQDTLSPDAAAPSSILLAAAGWHDQQTVGQLIIDQIRPHGTHATARRLFSIPSAAAVAFDPTGTRLLYVHGGRLAKLRLWEARIAGHRWRQPRILSRQSQIGVSAAWRASLHEARRTRRV